jgi:hypothetical protein
MFTIESLQETVRSMGYGNIKPMSGKKFAVLVDKNRVEVLEDINKKLPGSSYDDKPTSESSVGKVVINSFSILVKPASRQGSASAGVENELIVVKNVNDCVKNMKGPINVLFKAKNKTYEVFGIKEAKSVGADTAGRKKADIVLIDSKNKQYPISIKKDDAETWESADRYFKQQEAEKIIEKAIKANKTKLIAESTYFKIEPNIAVAATNQEKEDVVFGSDIKNGGAVITKTFKSGSFKCIEDKLEIECTHIITEMRDVVGDKDVMFLIRNDKTRKSIKKYPGIRVLASYKKRINRNVAVVQR